jgi:alpha-N-arabinofuranosidase
MLRAPKETCWKLNPASGQLDLTPRKDLLSGKGNPSFLARRVQHARFSASTCIEAPTEAAVSAGLAIFQNETHYYFLAVCREQDELLVYLERANGGARGMVGKAHVPRAFRIKLRVLVNDAKCSFEYAADANTWKTLVQNADATLLTTEVAGGFVGATVGMHARLDHASLASAEWQVTIPPPTSATSTLYRIVK